MPSRSRKGVNLNQELSHINYNKELQQLLKNISAELYSTTSKKKKLK